MAGWRAERTPRAAHRPSPVPPAGVFALMPPPSQGAERRTRRHAARNGSRWGLRVLVIGGLAGTAAHAADLAPAAEEPILGMPFPAGSQSHGLTRIAWDLTARTRLSGGPADSRQIAPVTKNLRAISEPAAQHRHHRATTDRHHTAVEADAPATVRETPAGDGPAPLQGYFGAVSGIPAVGSGSPTEGSSAVFLTVAVGEHAVASHRTPLATGVEARHHDAEAPTVSPD